MLTLLSKGQELLCRHELEHRDSTLAVCIIEPILQGANGMRMIDPLYQRVLVEACRYATYTCHAHASAMVFACPVQASLLSPTSTDVTSTGVQRSLQVMRYNFPFALQGEGHAGDQ